MAQLSITSAVQLYISSNKKKTKALLGDTALSTWAVYQPLSAKKKHIWCSRISPARCSCKSTAIKIESESTSGRHSHVDQGGINRDQQSENTSGARLHHQRGTFIAISKAKAYLSCISTAIENYGDSTSGRHSRVDQCGISTAKSKARAYPAQLYITSAV